MSKIKLLIIGYSSFVRRRVEPSLKKNKLFDYCISSKSNKINLNKKILFNNYDEALKRFTPEIVYISTVNSLHYSYAKKILNKGFNVIIDKPATLNIKTTNKLLKIAKKKKLLLAEATLFNYHRVFDIIKKLCKGFNQVEHIQSNLNHPLIRSTKEIEKIKGDCEFDMSPYAAAIIRLFTKNDFKNLNINRNYFTSSKAVKNFYITTNSPTCTYFGNFSFQREYNQQIIFYTKDKIVYSPQRMFAPPYDKDLEIIVKSKNEIKKIKVKSDDCINNFFKLILNSLKRKKYNFWLNTMLLDAEIRDIIKKN